MFYIDFTTPEGKTYRIDVSKNPVLYKCPICGEISIYKFDPTSEDCCIPCTKQRKHKELMELEEKSKEDEFKKKWLQTHSAKLCNLVEKHKVTKIDKPKRLSQVSKVKFKIIGSLGDDELHHSFLVVSKMT